MFVKVYELDHVEKVFRERYIYATLGPYIKFFVVEFFAVGEVAIWCAFAHAIYFVCSVFAS